MPTLAIMIGIQGSGKSTFCKMYLPEYERISLDDLHTRNKERFFDESIRKFTSANQHRLAYLKDEAFMFVRKAAERFKEENIVISFSGGKDSTVTADVVTKALSNPRVIYIRRCCLLRLMENSFRSIVFVSIIF